MRKKFVCILTVSCNCCMSCEPTCTAVLAHNSEHWQHFQSVFVSSAVGHTETTGVQNGTVWFEKNVVYLNKAICALHKAICALHKAIY